MGMLMKILWFLINVVVYIHGAGRDTGECAGLCNDVRLEVLSGEICRYDTIIFI